MLAPSPGYSTPSSMLLITSLLLALSSSPANATEQASFEVHPISESQRLKMRGVTWRKGCPVGLKQLREVHVTYQTPSGESAQGVLIVHESVAEETKTIFKQLFEHAFVFQEIQPASYHAGNDDHLMETNTTSAFNCRRVTGGKGFSKHSYGKAIDVNPLWNPYVKGKTVLPPKGKPFATNRKSLQQVGILRANSLPVTLFKEAGWNWGGDWKSLKDYQHLEKKSFRKKKTN